MHIFFLYFISIVGDDDGGKLFTPEEYEEYKRQVLPMVGFLFLFLKYNSNI